MASEHFIDDPLASDPPSEVPLPRAPLVRVLAQVRFPPILKLRDENHIASFQEALRRVYPQFAAETTANFLIGGAEGPRATGERRVWRLGSVDWSWRVSLAEDFLVLETTRYTSRKDFFQRFETVLRAANTHLEPQICTRLGVRYVDRLVGEAYRDLSRMVRSEMLGLVSLTPMISRAQYCVSDALFDIPGLPEGQSLRLRWGHVPPGSTVDPSTIEPVGENSWILDLDAFCVKAADDFDPETLATRATTLASRIYTVFRWTVTDHFLEHFGGGETS